MMSDQHREQVINDRVNTLDDQRRALFERKRAELAKLKESDRSETATLAPSRPLRVQRPDTAMRFSLFFFSGDGSSTSPSRYDLLLSAAEFGDRVGFDGIWVPERHFVDFGGLHPNPAVLAAAIATRTTRIGIRAGSVVLPLHHPVRVAEEWSVVDVLSNGRVSISVASGWHPQDFLLAPGGDLARTYQDRREQLPQGVQKIQALWRGDALTFPSPVGDATVRSMPRPIQPELPVWVSSQGAVDTFVMAGRLGADLLTGLVGQTPAGLAEKISAYRQARKDAGHDPGAGKVAVMVHTYLGDDMRRARAAARAPLIGYLRSFLEQQFSMDSEYNTLDAAAREAMLRAAVDRYSEGALIGNVESAVSVVEDLADLGVDEVACLVDFGLDDKAVLAGLEPLAELCRRYGGQ